MKLPNAMERVAVRHRRRRAEQLTNTLPLAIADMATGAANDNGG